MSSSYSPGALVRTRGRDWVVLPSEQDGVLRLRPIDGLEEHAIGVAEIIEPDAVKPADYPPPDPAKSGDFGGALLLARGVHPKIVSEMLGHSSIAITLDLYSHVTPTMQRETAAVMDSVLSG